MTGLVDDAGNLWVEEYPRPGVRVRRWTVFGTDFLLDRWVDDLGEEHVRLTSFQRNKPTRTNLTENLMSAGQIQCRAAY